MKENIKRFVKCYKKSRYDRKHNREALDALKVIEQETGYKLSAQLRNKIDKYAEKELGSKIYAPWLYVYTAYNKEFKEGWIPDNYFGYVVAPKVNNGLGKVSGVKSLSKNIIQSNLLPDKFYMVNQTLYDEEYKVIQKSEVEKALFKESDEYFFKKDNSSQGKGVFKITVDNFNSDTLYNNGNAVLQTPIIQSSWFDDIVTGSVATVRITTVINENKQPMFCGAYLRVARSHSSHVHVEDTIRIPIINDKGKLGEFGSDAKWKRHYIHPDTDFKFAGESIPYFSNAVSECLNVHKKLPHFTIIGWDVSITEEGQTKLIEWNAGHSDIKFIETTYGPCFKKLNWNSLHK